MLSLLPNFSSALKVLLFQVEKKNGMPGYVVVNKFGPAIEALKADPAWLPVYPYVYSCI